MGERAPLWLRLSPVIFLFLWSGGFPAVKAALPYTGPLTLLAIRYAIVLALLLAMFLVLRPPLPARPAEWGHLAVTGLLVQGLYFATCNMSQTAGMTSGGLALVMSLQPVLVALLAPGVAGEAVGLRRWLGLLIGLAGVVLFIAAGMAVVVGTPAALAWSLVALAGIAGGSLYEKRFGRGHHLVSASLVQFAVAFVATLPLAWWSEGLPVVWSWPLVLALAYLVIPGSLIAMTLLLVMIQKGEVSRVSALFFLVPPVAALMAWGLLGEALPPLAWAGMAVTVLGVGLAMRPATR